jgi:hypothetical protein
MLERNPATATILLFGAAIGCLACSTGAASSDHDQAQGVYSEPDDEGEDADEKEVPITGEALAKASAAALAFTGEGRVSGTEAGDEESYYEVEVTLADGRQVDVQLDENFKVVSSKNDDEEDGDDE